MNKREQCPGAAGGLGKKPDSPGCFSQVASGAGAPFPGDSPTSNDLFVCRLGMDVRVLFCTFGLVDLYLKHSPLLVLPPGGWLNFLGPLGLS